MTSPDLAHREPNTPYALFYGIGTLILLALGSGGDWNLSSERMSVYGPALLILALFGLARGGLLRPLLAGLQWNQTTRARLALGVGVGIASALPFALYAVLLHNGSLGGRGFWLPHPSATDALLMGVVVSGASELLHRGILQATWGVSGVAFLEALAWGLGWQSIVLFIATGLVGWINGHLAQRFGLFAAFCSRVVFGIVLFWVLAKT